MSQWYVLPVLSSQELKLEKQIRSIGYGAMAPWYEGEKYVRGNKRKWIRPLYVGYCFVSLPDPVAGWQRLNAELNTEDRRVMFQLLGGDKPAVLKQDDVEYLLSISDGKFSVKDEANQLVVGDCVLIPDGILKGQPSVVVEIIESKKRGDMATLVPKDAKSKMILKRPVAILSKV